MIENQPINRRAIIKEYHDTLDKMGIRTWAGFLEGDYWLRDEPGSDWGICRVCGKKQICAQYVGSHFRQNRTNFLEHQKAVDRYSAELKHMLNSILKKYGLRLKEGTDNTYYSRIWEDARLYTERLYGYWNEVVEQDKKEAK